jgi:hypothetical protein
MPHHFGQDNLTTHYDPTTGQTTLTPGSDGLIDFPWTDPASAQGYVNPTSWTVNLDASVAVAGSTGITSYKWTVPQGMAQPQAVPGSPNHFTWTVPAPGTYSVKLTVTDSDGQTNCVTQNVVVQDYFIASLGDSFASGEGNPDVPQQFDEAGNLIQPPVWEDERTHLSAFAGPVQAALQIQKANPQASVTFVSLADSGAKLGVGVLDPYGGREAPTEENPGESSDDEAAESTSVQQQEATTAPDDLLPPQIEQLAQLANGRPIDALVLSIGGNDVGFGNIVKDMITAGLKGSLAGSTDEQNFLDALEHTLPPLFARLASILQNHKTEAGRREPAGDGHDPAAKRPGGRPLGRRSVPAIHAQPA